jgi:hypothetical protein
MMLTVTWNKEEFHVTEMLPKGAKFNADYFCNCILPSLVPDDGCGSWNGNGRKMVIRTDTVRPYMALRTLAFMAENSMKPDHHPPYSLVLAPCDFYLFDYVKGRLTDRQFESHEDLFEAIGDILRAIPREKLIEVFLEWERRLQQSHDVNGEYVA